MKKVFAVSLSLILLLSFSGVELRLHFCCNRIASISATLPQVIQLKNKVENCCQSNATDTPCCSDKQVKIKSKQDLSTKQDLSKKVFIPCELIFFQEQLHHFCQSFSAKPILTARSNSPPFYLLYCRQVFYA